MTFDVFEFSNKGGRDSNEDYLGSRYEKERGIFVVADGLGGHSHGELASMCAVKTIVDNYDYFKSDGSEIVATINSVVEQANSSILKLQKDNGVVLKSTAAILAIQYRKAFLANVGDSRVYYFHDNELNTVTDDQSVAYKKYKAGEITRDQIGSDEDQSRLLRALGSEDRYNCDIKIPDNSVEPGDAFLLCSDGVWEYLKDEEILIDLLKSSTAQQWGELLLLRIMERVDGENDNLSVLTVKINP